ncbi:hypothetical protein [Streptomyces sp. NRRL B-1140]|uniref:hypothetical protein n=1 Tax=Streptomyces sp. NRRL B-1140 TaxID=1415549 RepID=UPI000A8C72DE|nr:hypothetical protein [Streptomyces sp. NRRL B-1140]
MMLNAAGDIASAALKGLSDVPATSASDGSGLWGTVGHPIRVFLADQAAHLAVAPAALYAFWQLTGLLGLVGGFFGNAGARIAWLLFGIGSLAMIWSAAPAGGRAAATGLAALMWALASIFALRGLTLRPIVHNHPPQYQFNPALHLHATIPHPEPGGRRPRRQHPPAPALTGAVLGRLHLPHHPLTRRPAWSSPTPLWCPARTGQAAPPHVAPRRHQHDVGGAQRCPPTCWRNRSCSFPARAAGSAGPARNVPAPATRTAPTGCPAPGAGDAAPEEEAPPPRGDPGAAQ